MTMQKTLALFDLDHTLLDIDSDYTWGEYIIKKGLVDEDAYRKANIDFYNQYIAGTLDATKYNEFVAAFLTTQTMDTLLALRADYIMTEVKPHIRPKAMIAITQHIISGDEVVIISATNDFVVSGIAQEFGIAAANVLATPLEVKGNRYTGKLSDKPNFKEGKLYHLNKWLAGKAVEGVHFEKSYGYSDSKNDIPLLDWVDTAICVTPDDVLIQKAKVEGWQIADWSL